MQKDWPRLLHLLNEELGYSVREGNPALGDPGCPGLRGLCLRGPTTPGR